MEIDLIFGVAILIMSVVIHEVSHGYAALFLGDHTAEYEGRLTLNPLKHLDMVGSIIVPAISYLLGGVIFGWAKPVPYNPFNLRNQRWGDAIVSIAGPVANIFLALLAGLALRYGMASGIFSVSVVKILATISITNIILAVFNLVPIPPLDGSKILFSILPLWAHRIEGYIERYGLIFLIIFLLFFGSLISPIISFLFKIITGLSL